MSSSGIGVLRPGLHNVVWDKLNPWLLLDKKGESVRTGTIVAQYSSTVVKRCQVGLLILVTKGASTDGTESACSFTDHPWIRRHFEVLILLNRRNLLEIGSEVSCPFMCRYNCTAVFFAY